MKATSLLAVCPSDVITGVNDKGVYVTVAGLE
jgi:hypothetical protein